jgi:hypothetical protein
MGWNANGVFIDEFLGENRNHIVLINETDIQPTKKWNIPAYTT